MKPVKEFPLGVNRKGVFGNAGQTPLHLAASQGYSACCEALIGQGANVMVADNVTKATPLHLAGKIPVSYFPQFVQLNHTHPSMFTIGHLYFT